MHVLEELKTLLLVSAIQREDPRIQPQLVRDTIEQLEQLVREIAVCHELLDAASAVIDELTPLGVRA